VNWDKLPAGKAKQAFVKWALSKKIPLQKAKAMANSKFGPASSLDRMMQDYGNKDPRWM
jgi:hypothetical protein